jgi:hypothetical protein
MIGFLEQLLILLHNLAVSILLCRKANALRPRNSQAGGSMESTANPIPQRTIMGGTIREKNGPGRIAERTAAPVSKGSWPTRGA